MEIKPAAVVDTTATRCPPVSAAIRAEFARVGPPPRPVPDRVDDAGREYLSNDAMKQDREALERDMVRKNARGRQLISELDKCRGDAVSS